MYFSKSFLTDPHTNALWLKGFQMQLQIFWKKTCFLTKNIFRTKHLHFVCANRFELDVRDFGQLM